MTRKQSLRLTPTCIHTAKKEIDQLISKNISFVQPLFVEIYSLRKDYSNGKTLTDVQLKSIDNIISILQEPNCDINNYYNVKEYPTKEKIVYVNVSGYCANDPKRALEMMTHLKAYNKTHQ
jgi:hypothetical protein